MVNFLLFSVVVAAPEKYVNIVGKSHCDFEGGNVTLVLKVSHNA